MAGKKDRAREAYKRALVIGPAFSLARKRLLQGAWGRDRPARPVPGGQGAPALRPLLRGVVALVVALLAEPLSARAGGLHARGPLHARRGAPRAAHQGRRRRVRRPRQDAVSRRKSLPGAGGGQGIANMQKRGFCPWGGQFCGFSRRGGGVPGFIGQAICSTRCRCAGPAAIWSPSEADRAWRC